VVLQNLNATIASPIVFDSYGPSWGGIVIPAMDRGPGDDEDTGAIIRNNTIYLTQSTAGAGIALGAGSGNNQQVVSNLIYYGAGSSASSYCFSHTQLSNYTAFANNLCHHEGNDGPWSATHHACHTRVVPDIGAFER